MKGMTECELLKIEGGINVSGTLINSFGNIIKIILEVGRSIGSSLRRVQNKDFCSPS